MMEILDLVQGSPEWLATRLEFGTASEASAMMGRSKYTTRNKLLDMKKTGISEEIDAHTQRIFDKGHAAEASIRPVVEALIGAELYPVTGTLEVGGVKLLASFDGLTAMGDINFEHKLWNETLAADVAAGDLDAHYTWQMEQQMLVSGAERTIFVVSDGTEDKMVFMIYEPVPGRAEKLVAGWRQFFIDLDEHEITEAKAAPVVDSIESLPVLAVQLNGSVAASNLAEYKAAALTFIKGINTELKTDTDFANAENAVKFCKKAEDRLKQAKDQALSQTADIAALFDTIDELSEELRQKRLFLDKEVKRQKESIKKRMVSDAITALQQHTSALVSELKGMQLPLINADFAGAIKGKRNLDSMQDAVSTALANAKIEADGIAQVMRGNLAVIAELTTSEKALFADMQSIVTKPEEDFNNLVNSRVAQYQKEEQARIDAERERIRQEEEKKAQAKVDAEKAENERQQREEAERLVAEQKEVVAESEQPAEPVAEESRPVKESIHSNARHADGKRQPMKRQPETLQELYHEIAAQLEHSEAVTLEFHDGGSLHELLANIKAGMHAVKQIQKAV